MSAFRGVTRPCFLGVALAMKRTTALTCLGLGIIWGCTYTFLQWSTQLITPLQTTFIRVLFGFLPIAGYAMFTGVLQWRHMRHLHHFAAMSILAGSVYFFAITAGTALLPSGIAGLLNGAIPLFAFLCAWLFLREERLGWLKGVGILMGFCGMVLIAAPWSSTQAVNPEGVAYMLFGALCFGASFVYTKRFISPLKIPAVALTTYQLGLTLLTLLAITPMTGIANLAARPGAMVGIVLGLGVLSTGVAYIAFYRLVESEGAVAASVVTYIPPVVALLIGVAAGEPTAVTAWVAMLLILAGVAVVQLAGHFELRLGVAPATARRLKSF